MSRGNHGFIATAVLYSLAILLSMILFIILKNTVTLRQNETKDANQIKEEILEYRIFYDGNGAQTGEVPETRILTGDTGQLRDCNLFQRTGYTCTGWSVSVLNPNNLCTVNNTTCFSSNATVRNVFKGGSKTTLYVVWKSNTYAITLHKNSGTGGSNTIYEKYGVGWYSDSNATSSITAITKPTRAGYEFEGYYTNSDGTGEQVIDASGKIKALSNRFSVHTTVYAKWKLIDKPIEITPKSLDPIRIIGSTTGTTTTTTKLKDLFTFSSTGPFPAGGEIVCKVGSDVVYKNVNGSVSVDAAINKYTTEGVYTVTCTSKTYGIPYTQTKSNSFRLVNRTFTYMGDYGNARKTTYQLYAGHKYSITLAGAWGGNDNRSPNGVGGVQSLSINAVAAAQLTLYAGGRGTNDVDGSWPDGQSGPSSGDGGGSTSIWYNGTLIAAAGGGGGSGQVGGGGNGHGLRCSNTAKGYTSFPHARGGMNGQTWFAGMLPAGSSVALVRQRLTEQGHNPNNYPSLNRFVRVASDNKPDGGGGGGGFPAGTNSYFHIGWVYYGGPSGVAHTDDGVGDYSATGGCGYNYRQSYGLAANSTILGVLQIPSYSEISNPFPRNSIDDENGRVVITILDRT